MPGFYFYPDVIGHLTGNQLATLQFSHAATNSGSEAIWSKKAIGTVKGALYQSVTNIFEYSNILGNNIYSDIRSGQFCLYEYIWTFVRVKFVCMNIFRHSFMSVLESENRPNIRTIFNTIIYSIIRLCQIFYTNIFGHSFV